MKFVNILESMVVLLFVACSPTTKDANSNDLSRIDGRSDHHSFSNPGECLSTHLTLEIQVNFDKRAIEGTATYRIENKGVDTFIVDTRDLVILAVECDGKPVETKFGPADDHLGRALKIPVSDNTESVQIRYRTSANASALGWLSPVQTAGKKAPFLYTQGQAILTRTWIPIQDSPGVRMTYDATVRVPEGLMAAMSATNPQKRSPDGVYHFEMEQPVPAYLIALAVGDFDFAPIGRRTGVYAEPPILEKAVYEFAEMEKMVEIAEDLYGPYLWGRYDVIVLPPSFPFGGMENPRLTFATPTIIAGDRSLMALVAHELAHSWSGNLVTNATWNDFWLNEGFTTYFELRIMESLYGEHYARMLALLGYQDLEKQVKDLGERHPDTHLFLDLDGRDPDDGMNSIAYEKGAYFLRRLEQAAGRERFDAFLREYFDKHKFQSMSTAQFVGYLKENLLEPEHLDIDIDAWIFGPGIPPDCPVVQSDRFSKVEEAVDSFAGGKAASKLETAEWTTHEWLHFIRHVPHSISMSAMSDLDNTFGFTTSGNSEVAAAWYELSLRHKPGNHESSYGDSIMKEIREFLCDVGRRKFLVPIYRAMKETGRVDSARSIFSGCRENYHAVSDGSIGQLLNS